MPKADQTKWTPLEEVADAFYRWTKGQDRPKNGSLLQLFTKEGRTEMVAAE